jgi:hypothetical protein
MKKPSQIKKGFIHHIYKLGIQIPVHMGFIILIITNLSLTSGHLRSDTCHGLELCSNNGHIIGNSHQKFLMRHFKPTKRKRK